MSLSVDSSTKTTPQRRLVTLSKVKTRFGITSTSNDDILGDLIDEASAAIVSYLGRDLSAQTYSEKVTGRGSPFLQVSRMPITSISSITRQNQGSTSSTTLDSTSYSILDGAAGLIFRSSGFEWDAQLAGHASLFKDPHTAFTNYTVTYTGGFNLPNDTASTGTLDLPLDIERACIITLQYWFRAAKRDPALKRIVSEDFELSYRGDDEDNLVLGEIPKSAMRILNPYKFPVEHGPQYYST